MTQIQWYISFLRQPSVGVVHQTIQVEGNNGDTSVKEVFQSKFTPKSSDTAEYASDFESSSDSEPPSVHVSAKFESGSSSGSSFKSTSGESSSDEEVEDKKVVRGDVMNQLVNLGAIKPLVDSSGRRVVVGEGSHGKAFLGNLDGKIVIVKTMTDTKGNIIMSRPSVWCTISNKFHIT